jgi:uncharacterized membrane protein
MRGLWKYLLVGLLVFGLVFVAVTFLLFPGLGWNGMMGNWGYSPMMYGGFGMMGGLMMLLVFLVPLGVIALIVVGVVALLRRPAQMTPPPQNPAKTCPNCGRSVQTDWTACPYCGKTL